MSGEHPNTTDTAVAEAPAAETSGEVETTASSEPEVDVSSMYADWDGELESLEAQPFYQNLDKLSGDDLREALKLGYSKARNNVTTALHTKAQGLAEAKKRYDSLSSIMEDKSRAFSERLEQFQKAAEASSDNGVAPEALEALKAGLQTKLDELQGKLGETEKQAAEYYQDNRKLYEGYQKLKWERDNLAQNAQTQMQALKTNFEAKLNALAAERDHFRGQVEASNRSARDRDFDNAFPHLAQDRERREEASRMYFSALQAHMSRLKPGEYYPDEQWEKLEAITQAQIKALYPDSNPPQTTMPAAETLAQKPGSVQTGGPKRRAPKPTGGIF